VDADLGAGSCLGCIGKDGDRPAKAEGPDFERACRVAERMAGNGPDFQGLLFPEMPKPAIFFSVPGQGPGSKHAVGSDQHGQLLLS